MDLFADQRKEALQHAAPLAVRMRPRTLDEFVGQEAFLGSGKLLRRLLAADRLTSAIFFGPPGCGKTTLAQIIANQTNAAFETLHAAEAGVKEVREVIEKARGRLTARRQRTVLFLDEIHRFTRAQQDVLLKDVEEGVLILIGATTENPFFSINGPLLSRGTLFEFLPLSSAQIIQVLNRTLQDKERGLAGQNRIVEPAALHLIADRSNGDARRALTALEIAVLSKSPEAAGPVTALDAADSMQIRTSGYDRSGDTHYDIASALIKSMRGCDPDAALYWLARMLEGGEDPRFIARRIAICASEDVGNADPQALVIAAAAVQVSELVGIPECEYALAQAAVYVACAPKSNAVTLGIAAAREDVRTQPLLPVPNHLRDKSYRGAARIGRGAGYQYPHDAPGAFLPQDYLGADKLYYNPSDRGAEASIGKRLAEWRRLRAAARGNSAKDAS